MLHHCSSVFSIISEKYVPKHEKYVGSAPDMDIEPIKV